MRIKRPLNIDSLTWKCMDKDEKQDAILVKPKNFSHMTDKEWMKLSRQQRRFIVAHERVRGVYGEAGIGKSVVHYATMGQWAKAHPLFESVKLSDGSIWMPDITGETPLHVKNALAPLLLERRIGKKAAKEMAAFKRIADRLPSVKELK